ncbi:MAG: hypothetical protein V4493_02130 [Pseudomonadota bacterium]
MQALAVYDSASIANIQLEHGLLVVAVRTQRAMLRPAVREQVRIALKQTLALLLNCPISEIELFSQPGQAVRLLKPAQNIGISISHEPELSLVAINMHGAIGVDAMATSSIPAHIEIHSLATDYLGHQTAEEIARLPENQQSQAFAKRWTEFEARMKCKGEPITEWSSTRDSQLAGYHCKALLLPQGYIGSIAYQN